MIRLWIFFKQYLHKVFIGEYRKVKIRGETYTPKIEYEKPRKKILKVKKIECIDMRGKIN